MVTLTLSRSKSFSLVFRSIISTSKKTVLLGFFGVLGFVLGAAFFSDSAEVATPFASKASLSMVKFDPGPRWPPKIILGKSGEAPCALCSPSTLQLLCVFSGVFHTLGIAFHFQRKTDREICGAKSNFLRSRGW